MQRLGDFFSNLMRRVLPDPIVIACGLTLFVIVLALLFPQEDALRDVGLAQRLPRVAEMWIAAVWSGGFLTFALQMCVVLLTGYGLARAPLAMRGLHALAGLAKTNRSAVVLVTLVSCAGCWINWGFGLIAGGVLAARVRDQLHARGVRCQYALLVAAAYVGMMIWHGGLSGSAPLKMAESGIDISRTTNGVPATTHLAAIDIRSTTLSWGNLVLSLALIGGIPLVMRSMATRRADVLREEDDETDDAKPASQAQRKPASGDGSSGLAGWLNRTRAVPIVIAGLALIGLGAQVYARGSGAVNLNFVNTVFLSLGLLLHRNLVEYAAAVAEGGRAVTGIILQFPLYGGIQGVMFGAGLAAAMSQGFVDGAIATADWLHISVNQTFPIATFLSAGLVNLFVPSGGGQWIVQGPIMCGAADSLHTSIEQTVMAVSYGDQWTNMIQPFWAIPLMGLTGVNVRRFMGYCALLMLLAGPVFAIGLLLFY